VTGVPALRAGLLAPVELAVIVLTPLAAFEATALLPAAAVQLQRSRVAAARILALLDAADAPAVDMGDAAPEQTGGGAHVLHARDLAVGWPSRSPALTGVDLDLRPGRTVAVVGPSGIGKTTLLLTLAGLLDPRHGSVTLDGTPLRMLDDPDRAARVVVTTEDAHVFGTTVLENLRVARGDVTPDQAQEALQCRSGHVARRPAGRARHAPRPRCAHRLRR